MRASVERPCGHSDDLTFLDLTSSYTRVFPFVYVHKERKKSKLKQFHGAGKFKEVHFKDSTSRQESACCLFSLTFLGSEGKCIKLLLKNV